MNFVVIVEPDHSNAEKIKAILETAEKDFSYALVESPDQAIGLFDNQEVAVLVSALHMPVMSGSELFDMIRMISPDTVPVILVDTDNMADTVAVMNECKAFKLILRPCRVAEDLLAPIHASIEYRNLRMRDRSEEEEDDFGINATNQKKGRLLSESSRNMHHYELLGKEFLKMLQLNLGVSGLSTSVQKRVMEWYKRMEQEYREDILDGTGDAAICKEKLISEFHHPETGCRFAFAGDMGKEIIPAHMAEFYFLLRVFGRFCQEYLYGYQIRVAAELVKENWILRFRCRPETFAVEGKNEILREEYRDSARAVMRAIKLYITAMGYQSAILERKGEWLVNVALKERQSIV
ncbi:MAG: response regulator [Roseburia sp.]